MTGLFFDPLAAAEVARFVEGHLGCGALARFVADLDQVLRQTHDLGAKDFGRLLPLGVVRQVGAEVLEGAGAAGAVADNNVSVLEQADVFFGEGEEVFPQPVGQMGQAAADVVDLAGRGNGAEDDESVGHRLREHHPHPAALKVGHFGVFIHSGGSGRSRTGQRRRAGETGEVPFAAVSDRRHAERHERAETELAHHLERSGGEFYEVALLHHDAEGTVFDARAAGLVGNVLAEGDHGVVGFDLAGTVVDAGPAQQAEIHRFEDAGVGFEAAFDDGAGDIVLAAGARGFDILDAEQRADRQAGAAAVALGDDIFYFLQQVAGVVCCHVKTPCSLSPDFVGVEDAFGVEGLLDGLEGGDAVLAKGVD